MLNGEQVCGSCHQVCTVPMCAACWARVGREVIGERFSFGEALLWLKSGGKVERRSWNGQGLWLALQPPDEVSQMLPFLFVTTTAGPRMPWTPSHTDILADDWSTVAR